MELTGSRILSAASDASSQHDAEKLIGLVEQLRPEPVAVAVEVNSDRKGKWKAACLFAEMPNQVELDLLAAACGCGQFEVCEVAETDWVSKVQEEQLPIPAGRFWIHSSHQAASAAGVRIPIEIDPSLAFGTGHHETTQGCLEVMSDLNSRGFKPMRACDVGCGTGILAIAAAKLWQCAVTACDNDSCAVEVAVGNLERNRVEQSVQLICCDGFSDDVFRSGGPFDLAVANIMSGPLMRLAPSFANNVKNGGRLVLSGLLENEGGQVAATFENVGFAVSGSRRKNDWLTLELIRSG